MIPVRPQFHLRSRLNPAVVCDIDHDGVFSQLLLVQMIQQFPARLIKELTHCVVFCECFRAAGLPIFGQQSFRRVVWRVRQHRSVPEKERLLFLCRMLDKIKDGLHSFATNLKAIIAMPSAFLRKPASHPVGETAARKISFPPFAGLHTEIAFLSQQFWQCRLRIDL